MDEEEEEEEKTLTHTHTTMVFLCLYLYTAMFGNQWLKDCVHAGAPARRHQGLAVETKAARRRNSSSSTTEATLSVSHS